MPGDDGVVLDRAVDLGVILNAGVAEDLRAGGDVSRRGDVRGRGNLAVHAGDRLPERGFRRRAGQFDLVGETVLWCPPVVAKRVVGEDADRQDLVRRGDDDETKLVVARENVE